MSLLCDWCKNTKGFYRMEKGLGPCDAGKRKFRGRRENCDAFTPTAAAKRAVNTPRKWKEFTDFYGDPHPAVARRLLHKGSTRASPGLQALRRSVLRRRA